MLEGRLPLARAMKLLKLMLPVTQGCVLCSVEKAACSFKIVQHISYIVQVRPLPTISAQQTLALHLASLDSSHKNLSRTDD